MHFSEGGEVDPSPFSILVKKNKKNLGWGFSLVRVLPFLKMVIKKFGPMKIRISFPIVFYKSSLVYSDTLVSREFIEFELLLKICTK